jgi:hypothetical protein
LKKYSAIATKNGRNYHSIRETISMFCPIKHFGTRQIEKSEENYIKILKTMEKNLKKLEKK